MPLIIIFKPRAPGSFSGYHLVQNSEIVKTWFTTVKARKYPKNAQVIISKTKPVCSAKIDRTIPKVKVPIMKVDRCEILKRSVMK